MAYPDLPNQRLIVNGVDLSTEYGLVLVDGYTLSPPEPKTITIKNNAINGVIDLTETILGDTAYNNRSMSFNLYKINCANYETLKRQLSSFLHGKKYEFKLSFDPDYTYTGRFKIDSYAYSNGLASFTVSVDAEPYKFKKTMTYKLNVIGGNNYVFESGRKKVHPIVECEDIVYFNFDNVEYAVPAGTHTLNKVLFSEGQNNVYINSYLEYFTKWYNIDKSYPYIAIKGYKVPTSGSTAKLSLDISYSGSIKGYQWKYKTDSETSWHNIDSGTSSTCNILYSSYKDYSICCDITYYPLDSETPVVYTTATVKLEIEASVLTSASIDDYAFLPSVTNPMLTVKPVDQYASAFENVTYQWEKSADTTNWESLGVYTKTCTLEYNDDNKILNFRCKVTTKDSSSTTIYSEVVKLYSRTLKAVDISGNTYSAIGETVTLKVTLKDQLDWTLTDPNYTYNWQCSTDNGFSWTENLSSTATYSLTVQDPNLKYMYRCVVTSKTTSTSVSSSSVYLTKESTGDTASETETAVETTDENIYTWDYVENEKKMRYIDLYLLFESESSELRVRSWGDLLGNSWSYLYNLPNVGWGDLNYVPTSITGDGTVYVQYDWEDL